jgi:hypothetical protein
MDHILEDYNSKIERYTHEIYSYQYLLDQLDDQNINNKKRLKDKQHISTILHKYECKLMKAIHIKNIVYYN